MIDTEKLRSRILSLAMRGELSERSAQDGLASDLYAQIIETKSRLVKSGNIRKDKKYEEIEDNNMPYQIPDNWCWVRFGKIINLQSGQDLKPSEYNDHENGIPYITGASNYGNDGSILINRWTDYPKAYAYKNDILLSCKGTVGKLTVLQEKEVHIARQIMGIRTYDVDVDYIFYYLQSMIYGIKEAQKGLIPGIERNDVLDLLCPLPPVPEQKRIVKKIEALFYELSQIENLQGQYTSNQETLKSKLIDAAIQGKLTEQFTEDGTAEELYQTISEKKKDMQKRKEIKSSKPLPEISEDEIPFEIPSNWKWVHLDDITTKITSGSTPAGGRKSNAYVESGNCFFREQNIYNDGVHQEGMVYITDELLSTRENSTVIAKDILLNITGGSIGRCALIPEDFGKGSINQHILIIRMVDDRLRFYVHKLLCSPYAQRYIKDKSVGDKDGFSGGRCKKMLIPIPPLAEQQRIAEKIDEVLSAISMAG